jgi:hypothetical protein
MNHYDFPKQFRALYDKAVGRYAQNQRNADAFFTAEEKTFLAANGITPQHLYDYAEDHNNYDGEPGFELAFGIELIRRDYFLNEQSGRPSPTVLDEATLPPKDATVAGISWLPRLIPKARAKLRGELPPSLMYCCGGDRKFFKEHDIMPLDFLGLIWRQRTDEPVVAWVAKRAGK